MGSLATLVHDCAAVELGSERSMIDSWISLVNLGHDCAAVLVELGSDKSMTDSWASLANLGQQLN